VERQLSRLTSTQSSCRPKRFTLASEIRRPAEAALNRATSHTHPLRSSLRNLEQPAVMPSRAAPRCFPLADAAEAHRLLESGRTTGMLVLIS
jgi:hypothetical protein